MPIIKPPHTDDDRLALLQQTYTAAQDDATAGNEYLSAALIADINRIIPRWREKLRDRDRLYGERTNEIAEKDAVYIELQTFVRDFWDVLTRRVNRHRESVQVLDYYRIPRDGINPDPTNLMDWLQAADHIVHGERNAVAAGAPPMVNPSAREVQDLRNQLRREKEDAESADRALDDQQHDLDAMRPDIIHMIRVISGQLDFALYRLAPDDIRHIKRRYGFIYALRPGEEAEDESDVPADGSEGTSTT